ncbi:putative ERG20-farnesyl-pyrophosphate synthetase [Tilletiaria anomala UBC 951]|uniref:(2E,6E)-farnesyl diphosphate synthase n=1 Tax=Tilletiaria anomala (strain ATCC 24038 / CBS 436.72 / UBC 951) TaxID=1037660 RepID=A0A066W3E3_TILAU|nr:putative ERG20-farnesyl-pyrophosphate synthetase [Tilletiaria anomala UBC 951]KDN48472.1 putative ERG20-farnesyl-pyrophosphate synthetase [Tilletiaria anomala UBC 951]
MADMVDPQTEQKLIDKAQEKLVKRKRFEEVFPILVDELMAYCTSEGMPQDAKDWFKRSLMYNTPGGKLNRGLSVVDTVEIMLCTDATGNKTRELSEPEYLKAAILGWCIELLQAYFLVADDMMDKSITRRGQPCWYKVEGVAEIAINDSFMLEAAIYFFLKKHFRSDPCYVHLLELFHDVTLQTELGQLVDLITAPEESVDLSKFSLTKHHLIVVYKTAYYSFYLPVALAMRLINVEDEALYKSAQDILIPLGEYFQVQDDYLDCYGAPEVIGKIGTDILDNKCSWLINIALASATEEQRAVLDANYGRKDAACEAKVKEVYQAPNIDIKSRFEAYEKESYQKINALIEALPQDAGAVGKGGLKREVFRAFLNKVYKRTK